MNRPLAGEAPLALVVSPSLQGHRVTYCRVFSALLHELGYRVVVAGNIGDREIAGEELLADLRGWPDVELIDIVGRHEGGHFRAGGLSALLGEVGPDLTLLAEADGQIPALVDEGAVRAGRRPGRVIGLFIRSTNYIYQARPSLATRVRRRLRGPVPDAVDHKAFHEKLLVRDRLLDAALVLDENFARDHAATHMWMPDIFRETGEPHSESSGETEEWAARVEEFLVGSGQGPVVVYVGAEQQRRGYDTLLRVALEEHGRFLHCGELGDPQAPGCGEVNALREALAARGALLETSAPYLRPETAGLFLRAARCVVLPYRGHDGSSGMMLQAFAAGRPVLVPDRGLMAWRVRSFGLGDTYRDGDYADLVRRFRALDAVGPQAYECALASYIRWFSRDQLRAAVEAAIDGGRRGAKLPQGALGQPVGANRQEGAF